MRRKRYDGSKARRKMIDTLRGRISFLVVIALCLSMVVGITPSFAGDTDDIVLENAELQAAQVEAIPSEEAGNTEIAVTHDVFFYDAEGNEFQHVQVQDGASVASPVTEPSAPEGMTFKGWFEENADAAYPFDGSAVTGELKLYAAFEAVAQEADAPVANNTAAGFASHAAEVSAPAPVKETYTVTYMVDGTVYKTDEVEAETLADLSAPTGAQSSQPFIGWYIDREEIPFSAYRLVESDITLTAKFNDDVLVTYLDTDGREFEVFEIAKGEVAPKTDRVPAVADGQEFLYWTLQGSDAAYTFADPVHSHITLVPKTEDIALAIFVTNGTEIEPQTGTMGFTADMPADPQRMGYVFDGWYTDESYTETFDFANTPINGTVFIYAKWNAGSANYIVNLWAEKANTDAGDPADEANRGDYDLFYTKEMTDGNVGQAVSFDEDSAKAQWTNVGADAKEILTFSTFEYSEEKEVSAFGDTVVNVFYKRTEFTFNFDVNWVHTSNYSVPSTTPLAAEIFLANGDSVGSTYEVKVKLGQDISAVWPTRVEITKYNNKETTSYYFSNWSGYYGNGAVTVPVSYLTVAFSAPRAVQTNSYYYTVSDPVRDEVTLYPRVVANPWFETRYYYTEISRERYEELLTSNPDSVRAWAADHATYGGERYYELARTAEVAAQSSDPGKILTSGDNKGLPTAAGWPGSAIKGYETIGSTSTSACRTRDFQALYADDAKNSLNNSNRYYKIEYYMPCKSYDLTLVMNNGSITDPSDSLTAGNNQYTADVTYGEDISEILPKDDQVTRTNYTFEGWYTDSDFNVKYDGSSMPANGLTLYAKFAGTEVTVVYSDGMEITSSKYARNDMLTSHNLAGTAYDGIKKNDNVPGKGYFQGWYYTIGTGKQVDVEFPLGLTLTQDRYVLRASFTPTVYTVTFNTDAADGNYVFLKDQDVTSGNSNTLARSGYRSTVLSNPDGYTFVGWSTTPGSATADFSTSTRILEDTTVYPVWKINEYRVIYEGGTPSGATNVAEASTYTYKSVVTVAEGPVLDGYTFVGWRSSKDGSAYSAASVNEFTMPAHDVTLTAQWAPIPYRLSFDLNGATGTAPHAQSLTPGSKAMAVANPAWEGHSFLGWSAAANGGESNWNFKTSTMPAHDVVLYAQWKVNEPTGGGTVEPEPDDTPTDKGPTDNDKTPDTDSEEPADNDKTPDTDSEEPTDNGSTGGGTIDSGETPTNGGSTGGGTTTNRTTDRSNTTGAKQSDTGVANVAMPGAAGAGTIGQGSTAESAANQTPQAQTAAVEGSDETDASMGMATIANADIADEQASVWLGDNQVPLFGRDNSVIWALVNLILAIGGAVLAGVMLVVGIVRRRKKDEENAQNAQDDAAGEEGQKRRRIRPVWLIVSIVLGIAGVIAFLLTEDMRHIMVLMDNWIVLMVILFAAEVVCSVFAAKRRKKNDNTKDEEASMPNGAYGMHGIG